MPDPSLKTISATQAAALFDASPYITKWGLWSHFAKGLDISAPADALMNEGTLLQPYLLERCAAELGLVVEPNHDYVRRGLLGCTRDAIVICPDRGLGALEIKCVFNFQSWREKWGSGAVVPRHIEIQTQAQMHVGGEGATFPSPAYSWGIICAYFGGQRHYFERKYLPDFGNRLEVAAAEFFASVVAGDEPDPFGDPVELPWLAEMFPTVEGKVLDLRDDENGERVLTAARTLELQRVATKIVDKRRAEILAVAKDAGKILLPDKAIINISAKQRRITVYDPNGEKE